MQCNEYFSGNPLFLSDNRIKDFSRTTLIKSFIQGIPTYYILCEDLDKVVQRFWWTGDLKPHRYVALTSWDKVYQPKLRGGLGIRCFADIHVAFIDKLGWMIASSNNTLWIEIMRRKYGAASNFWSSELPRGASNVAKGIWSIKNLIQEGCSYLIGEGNDVDLWNSPWVLQCNIEEIRAAFNPMTLGSRIRATDLFTEGQQ
ncbi:hypothetical protein TorRG33x02_010560 [Trema orientale]|uniref:Uncharacterized protein n=1 Tax=Trema orientale TaxID=63057 RepID=A0A2P5FYY6_TREOI|nr:hypothetical protein TorRG33x02_010560 [Trema orientale]